MASNTDFFTPQDRLRTLIERFPRLLGVTGRFGLSLGFGDKSVGRVCEDDNVDKYTFLAVCNFLCEMEYRRYPISLHALMDYLRKAHTFFLDFLLPSIRRKLIEAINHSDINDVSLLLLKFFDDYVQEVKRHMQHENETVFSYVTRLLAGETSDVFRITEYSETHVSMTEKLNALKDVFICHYHVKDNEILNSALYDIIFCGEELSRHCEVENKLFIPEVEKLEKSLKLRASKKDSTAKRADTDQHKNTETLTSREKEIIRCVAKGMANKEIADSLCLSIHTVTTHRKNISAKLQIHSPAGLTIFAILHNLIDIEEIRPKMPDMSLI